MYFSIYFSFKSLVEVVYLDSLNETLPLDLGLHLGRQDLAQVLDSGGRLTYNPKKREDLLLVKPYEDGQLTLQIMLHNVKQGQGKGRDGRRYSHTQKQLYLQLLLSGGKRLRPWRLQARRNQDPGRFVAQAILH